MRFKTNNLCLVCGAHSLHKYLDLGNQPLANSYHKGGKLNRYPLEIMLCDKCWHSQLSVSVDPSVMFEHYLYVSDTSKTLRDYFLWARDYILREVPEPDRVLEIACNSGMFLEMFKERGLECYGIDPAQNLKKLSEDRGLNVYVDYWGHPFANRFRGEIGTVDLILACHVLPHVADPNEFVRACQTVLSDKGKAYIQTSQCDMLVNNELDVIYHEHSSYFTGRSIKELAHRNGLYVSSIIKTDIHSKSYLFSLQKGKCDESQLELLIDQETQAGIYTLDKYTQFAQNAAKIKDVLLAGLEGFRYEGYTIIGYGAAAKGNTLLNYIKFRPDFIIDDNPMKWGYLTPGQDTEISGIDLLEKNFEKVCFVPLAWNFYDEIKERISKVRNNDKDVFVRYFPEYKEER